MKRGFSGPTQSGHEHTGSVRSEYGPEDEVDEVRVRVGLWCLVHGRTSRADSPNEDFGQSAALRVEHELLVLSGVCTQC
jgi:hypothetical protein